MQALSYAQGYGGTVSNIDVSDPGDLDKPFHYTYDYMRENYSDWSNHRITPPLPPTGIGVRDTQGEKDEPKSDTILIGPLVTVNFTSHIQLPVSQLNPPAPVHLSTDFADYNSESTFKDGVLTTIRDVKIKETEISSSRQADWDKFRRAIYDDENNYIQLTGLPSTAASSSENDQPTALIQQAQQALQQRDITSARRMVEQALHADPKALDAHLLMANIDMMSGARTDDAIAELHKELALHPTNVYAYRMLGSLLTFTHPTEVHNLWVQMVKAMPDNPEANSNLAGSEYDLGHYDLAAKYYEKALVAYPDNSAILTRYAASLMKSGQTEKAIPLLEKTITLNPSPDALNSVAYTLADAGVHLDDALKYVTQALEAAEKDTSQISIDSIGPQDNQRMTTLAADWDTLGWINFKQGNYASADKFLQAAWRLGGDSASAMHLGELEEKKGNKAAAIRYYKSSYSIKQGPEVKANLERLIGKKVNLGMDDIDPMHMMKDFTITIPHTTPNAEFATYNLLVKPDGTVVAVKWVSGSKKLQPYLKFIPHLGFPTMGLPSEPDVRVVRRADFLCRGGNAKCDVSMYPTRIGITVN